MADIFCLSASPSDRKTPFPLITTTLAKFILTLKYHRREKPVNLSEFK
jgi:hypothetical protein